MDSTLGYQIAVASSQQELVDNAGHIIAGCGGLMEQVQEGPIKGQAVTVTPFSAIIANSKIKLGKNGNPMVREAYASAVRKPAFPTSWEAPYGRCSRCGAYTDGQNHCPSCGKRQRGLSKLAKGYLILVVIFSIGIQWDTIYWSIEYLIYNPYLAVNLVLPAVLIAAVILILTYRKIGFWILIGFRLFTALVNIVFYYNFSFFQEIVSAAVFIFVAYACMHKDLPHMK